VLRRVGPKDLADGTMALEKCLCAKYARSMNGAFNTEDPQGLSLRGR
jgi:hypothetical protein